MRISKEYKIGLAVFVSILLLFFGVNYLKGKNVFTSDKEYEVYYDRIDELAVGSYVLMRGCRIGVVNDISFVGEKLDSVKVQFIISGKIRFPKDSKVRVYSRDLMGTKGLDIIQGESDIMMKEGGTFIGEAPEGIKEAIDKHIEPIKSKAIKILDSMDVLLANFNSIVNNSLKTDINIAFNSLKSSLNNLESSSISINNILTSRKSKINNAIDNLDLLSQNLADNSKKISGIIDNFYVVSDTLRNANLGRNLKDLRSSINNLVKITNKLTTKKGTAGAMINDIDLYTNLKSSTQSLTLLLDDIKNNPRKYFNFSVINFGGKSNKKNKKKK